MAMAHARQALSWLDSSGCTTVGIDLKGCKGHSIHCPTAFILSLLLVLLVFRSPLRLQGTTELLIDEQGWLSKVGL
jgi:hypothetical protein